MFNDLEVIWRLDIVIVRLNFWIFSWKWPRCYEDLSSMYWTPRIQVVRVTLQFSTICVLDVIKITFAIRSATTRMTFRRVSWNVPRLDSWHLIYDCDLSSHQYTLFGFRASTSVITFILKSVEDVIRTYFKKRDCIFSKSKYLISSESWTPASTCLKYFDVIKE